MRDFFKQSAAAVLLASLLLCGCTPAAEIAPPDNPIIAPTEDSKIDTAIPDPQPDADPTTADPPVETPPVEETPAPSVNPEPVLHPEKEIDAPFSVIVDAGHGGSDPGAIVGDVYEAPINLAIALKLAAILEQNGVEVVLTRDSDKWMSLPERYTLANEKNADLSISLHCNIYGADTDVAGLECYYRAEAPLGRAFAQRVLDAAKATGAIRTRNTRVEDYKMLIHPKMPSVLVEMGFMTCPEELQKLCSDAYQQTMAQALAEAVLNTLNS